MAGTTWVVCLEMPPAEEAEAAPPMARQSTLEQPVHAERFGSAFDCEIGAAVVELIASSHLSPHSR